MLEYGKKIGQKINYGILLDSVPKLIIITRIGRDVCKPVKRTIVKISRVKERSTLEIICPQIIIAIIAGRNELKHLFVPYYLAVQVFTHKINIGICPHFHMKNEMTTECVTQTISFHDTCEAAHVEI